MQPLTADRMRYQSPPPPIGETLDAKRTTEQTLPTITPHTPHTRGDSDWYERNIISEERLKASKPIVEIDPKDIAARNSKATQRNINKQQLFVIIAFIVALVLLIILLIIVTKEGVDDDDDDGDD